MKDENIRVKVLINNFKDEENYNKEIVVYRENKEIKLCQKLLMKNDEYFVTKKRAKYLSDKKIIEIVERKTSSKENEEN